jgi:hypothetical protein
MEAPGGKDNSKEEDDESDMFFDELIAGNE